MSYSKELDRYRITRIICYVRKSRQDLEREKRTGEDTLTSQVNLMEKTLNVFDVPFDLRKEVGSGDKIDTRPVFKDILEILETTDMYQAIAVKELSRLGRGSMKDMGRILDLIMDKRLIVITPFKIYDITNEADYRQMRFELFLSREEYETTRGRLTNARYAYAMEGKWVAGSAPFGYKYNKRTQKLDIDEDTAKYVRMIYDWFLNGIPTEGGRKEVSFRAIAGQLQRLGIPTSTGEGEWHYVTVRRLLESRTYIGEVRFRTTQRKSNKEIVERPTEEHIIVPNAHEAIIDEEMFNKVQDKITNRKPTHNTKLDFSPCELAGIAVCSKCGRRMVRQYSVQHYKKKDGTVNVYHKEFLWCNKSGCTFVKYRDVEKGILGFLEYLCTLDKKLLNKKINETLAEEKPEELISLEEIRETVEKRKNELMKRKDLIMDKLEKGIYSDEEYLDRKKKIEEELEDLEKALSDKEKAISGNDQEEVIYDADTIRNNIESLLEAYHALDDKSDKNRLLHSFIDHVEINLLEKGRGRKPAKFELTPVLSRAVVDSNLLV